MLFFFLFQEFFLLTIDDGVSTGFKPALVGVYRSLRCTGFRGPWEGDFHQKRFGPSLPVPSYFRTCRHLKLCLIFFFFSRENSFQLPQMSDMESVLCLDLADMVERLLTNLVCCPSPKSNLKFPKR